MIDWSKVKDETAEFVRRFGAVAQRMGAALDQAPEFLRDSREHLDGEWGYLARLAGGLQGVTVAMSIEAARRAGRSEHDAVVAVVRRGLKNPELIAEVDALVASSGLDQPRIAQIGEGLRHYRAGNDALAVPLLIIPIEGAYWLLAQKRGLIEQRINGTWVARIPGQQQPTPIRGVESVLKLDGFGASEPFVKFFTRVAYGGHGHPFRHGTAEGGFEVRAIVLFVTLIGWLEAAGLVDADALVSRAFRGSTAVGSAAVPQRPQTLSEIDDGAGSDSG